MTTARHDETLDPTLRKYKGAFYTPKIWVDEVHKEMDKTYGKGWLDRDDLIVWDCCAGSGNLTRDYPIRNLLLSSLMDSEIEILKTEQGERAEVFQYDFLSQSELPIEIHERLLREAQAGKRLIFLMNPPYGGSGEAGTKEGASKTGIALSKVKEEMVKAGLGKPSNNLYIQFLYQTQKLAEKYGFKEWSICAICPISHFSSSTYKKFRSHWWGKHEFKGGFMFQASEFQGLSDMWAITFQMWDRGTTELDKDLHLSIRVRVDD